MPRSLKEFYFTIDLRSLGLYRIFLALLLIVDWSLRWPDLEAFYTSFGVLPVGAPLPKSGGEFHFCLLDGITSLPLVQAAFCAGLLFYGLLLIGYRTRVFHFLSLLFFLSVLSRNVLIRDGSVVVLATMLLWTLFLPMGKRFSLDALIEEIRTRNIPGSGRPSLTRATRGRPPGPHAEPDAVQAQLCSPSLAAFAVVAQIGLIYFFTASAKYGMTWRDGTALYYALNEDVIVRPLGQWVAAQPLVLIKTLTWSALGLEFAALPLILAPLGQPWLRRLAMLGLGGLHLGIGLTTTLAFFSATMIATYALLLLPEDWTLMCRIADLPVFRRMNSAMSRLQAEVHPRLANWIKKTPMEPSPSMSLPGANWRHRLKSWSLNITVFLLLMTFILDGFNLNVTKRLGWERIPEPRWMCAIIQSSLIQHDWELFAPDPIRNDGWFVISGETEDGRQLDPLTGLEPTFEKPANLSSRYDRFWRKYLQRLWLRKNHAFRLYFGKYITRKNHRDAPEGSRLTRFSFYFVKEHTPPAGTPQPWPTEKVLLWKHDCFPKAIQAKPPESDPEGAESTGSE